MSSPSCMLGLGRYIICQFHQKEFDSVFILVDLSCTIEEREIETSFEVGSDFWLRGPGE